MSSLAASNSSLAFPDVEFPRAAGPTADSGDLLRQIDDLRLEVSGLKTEINMLRRRDETLKFYMGRFDEEMRLAARLQQDFLPRSLPEVGPIRFHTLFRPAGYVSGDLYDVMRLDEHHVGFFIVDAVGHGMPAALLTMFIKRALVTKEICKTEPCGYRLLPPAETFARLNDALIEQDLSSATFATAAYGIINTQSLELTLSRAGHPHPLLLRDGAFEPIGANGSLLGIFAGETFTSVSLTLHPRDRMILYSDGIEVAFSADEACGPADPPRWRKTLLERCIGSAEATILEFGRDIDAEIGSLQPKDDLTVVLMEVVG